MSSPDWSQIAAGTSDVLIIARAGCGKSSALASISKAVTGGILALNVTKRSKRELQIALDRKAVTGVENRTVHSLAYEIVKLGQNREVSPPLGYFLTKDIRVKPTSDVIDDEQAIRLLIRAAIEEGFLLNHAVAKDLWLRSKNAILFQKPMDRQKLTKLRNWDSPHGQDKQRVAKIVHEILFGFETHRFENGLLCFEDLVAVGAALMSQHRDITKSLTRRYPTVLVDELQDLSCVQMQIVTALRDSGSRIIMAGDPAQFINEFMGASESAFDSVADGSWELTQIQLNKSHRLTPSIAKVGALIQNGIRDGGLKIRGRNKNFASKKPEVIEYIHDDAMISDLVHRIKTSKVSRNEIAVLYRIGRGSSVLAKLVKALELESMPFLRRPLPKTDKLVVQDFTSILKASFSRRVAPRSRRRNNRDTLRREELVKRLKDIEPWPERVRFLIENFQKGSKRPRPSIMYAMERWLLDYNNIDDAIEGWQEDFEYHVARRSTDAITLSTIHSSKGSEFQKVFVLDTSHRALSSQMRWRKADRKIAHHLMYVATTRPKAELTLMYSAPNQLSPVVKGLITKGVILSVTSFI